MIVPRFTVDQNEEFIIVVARTPYIRASEADFYLLGNQFKFYCKPYFLRLTFSHNIIENGKEKASYNVNTLEFTFYLPKENVGEQFNDLDLITKLLEKKSTNNNTPKIQLIDENDGTNLSETIDQQLDDEDNQDEDGDDENEQEEWEFDQHIEPELSLDELKNKVFYGFNDSYCNFFNGLQEEIQDIIDIPMIDSISKSERTLVRKEFENMNFDADRYMEIPVPITSTQFNPSNLEDYDDDEEVLNSETQIDKNETDLPDDIISQINSTLAKKVQIVNESDESTKPSTITTNTKPKLIVFTDDERDIMKNLPNKSYMISNENSLLLGLVDIIFSYAFNYRINLGDSNTESAWNICKVSTTLSCLETFTSLSSVIESSFKRAITYPLYRSWSLCEKVLEDTKTIFQLGKRCLLKCLLDIKKILEGHDFKHYLNRLYIDDYCVWLQHASSKKLKSLKSSLSAFKMDKSSIEWPLEAYEKLVEEEGMVWGEDYEEEGEEEEEQERSMM
ncbi:hypothetical protein CYY_007524 [Polysphondylium violaceum]|uniref:CS domain-containing protein n=1 Tax=Polysphondylium violaceum TaxID=133409 RepID=A0A8J4PRR4_9MYCE|nr:hypothetical protein CYY_007524 [Polysphondylium violaceum]